MRPHFALLVVFLSALTLPSAALAQTPTFNVEGVVTDAQQAVLPGVTVTIRNVATGLTRTATTDADGRYVCHGLPPEGRYKLQAELPGFAEQVRNNLMFNAGQRAVLNVQMKLSSVQETVTVAGESPLVQTTSAEVSSTDRPTSVRDAAGEGAQLLPPPVARLERRRQRGPAPTP